LIENIVKPFNKTIRDKTELLLLRISVVLVAFLSLLIALGGDSIYDLAADSSAMTLVTLFFPLFLGLYWKKSSTIGAIGSMIIGLLVWVSYDRIFLDSSFPSAIIASFASMITMIVFSIAFPNTGRSDVKSS
jgi:Na+/proline symporter